MNQSNFNKLLLSRNFVQCEYNHMQKIWLQKLKICLDSSGFIEAHEIHEENTEGGKPNVSVNGYVVGVGNVSVKN